MKKSLATIAVLATAAASASPALASAPSAATIFDCAGHAQAKPSAIILFCGDANQSLIKLRWSRWGSAEATATAVEVINTCTPDCAAGHNVERRVRVTVSDLRNGHYTRLAEAKRHFDLTPTGAVIA